MGHLTVHAIHSGTARNLILRSKGRLGWSGNSGCTLQCLSPPTDQDKLLLERWPSPSHWTTKKSLFVLAVRITRALDLKLPTA